MPKKHPPKLSPKLEVELRDKLEELLDERDDVASKKSSVRKLLSGHLKVLDESISMVRRQLKGQDLDQLGIPGTEKPEPASDPLLRHILDLAGGIVEKPKEDGKPEPRASPLEWHTEGENHVAPGKGGTYCVEPDSIRGWNALWTPTDGRSKKLGVGLAEAEAKDACTAHHLERLGDEKLREAGDGDLVRGDLKGEPEAWKKRKAGGG